jgi:hypothetical protein
MHSIGGILGLLIQRTKAGSRCAERGLELWPGGVVMWERMVAIDLG